MSDDWEEELAKEEEIEKQEEEKKKKEEAKKLEEQKKKEEERKKEEEKKKAEEKKKKEEEEKKKKENPNSSNIELKTEKDFLLLAQLNSSKIKKANLLPIFTLSYLKNIVELLGETLDLNQIKEIEKLINKVYNEKLKEGIKRKGTNKPVKATINLGGHNDDDADDDDYNEEEEEEEEKVNDDNIDNYI